MTSAEFTLWLDEYRRNPWGENRDAINAAYIVQTIMNTAGKSLKKPVDLADCMLEFDKQAAPEPDPVAHFKQFLTK